MGPHGPGPRITCWNPRDSSPVAAGYLDQLEATAKEGNGLPTKQKGITTSRTVIVSSGNCPTCKTLVYLYIVQWIDAIMQYNVV